MHCIMVMAMNIPYRLIICITNHSRIMTTIKRKFSNSEAISKLNIFKKFILLINFNFSIGTMIADCQIFFPIEPFNFFYFFFDVSSYDTITQYKYCIIGLNNIIMPFDYCFIMLFNRRKPSSFI